MVTIIELDEPEDIGTGETGTWVSMIVVSPHLTLADMPAAHRVAVGEWHASRRKAGLEAVGVPRVESFHYEGHPTLRVFGEVTRPAGDTA